MIMESLVTRHKCKIFSILLKRLITRSQHMSSNTSESMNPEATSGPYQDDRKRVQETVYYMASRLRAASIQIYNSEKNKQEWMYSIFSKELVIKFISSFY